MANLRFVQIGVSFVVGILLTLLVAYMSAPSMMLGEIESPYGAKKTVEMIQKDIKKLNESQGTNWKNPSVKPLHKSIKKHGAGSIRPVYLVNLCEPSHAKKILSGDERKKVSVMMPCTVTVYEKSNGKAYIGHMNPGIMGSMFGGKVAEVMGKVAEQQEKFYSFATQ